jgi:hypothetical protein
MPRAALAADEPRHRRRDPGGARRRPLRDDDVATFVQDASLRPTPDGDCSATRMATCSSTPWDHGDPPDALRSSGLLPGSPPRHSTSARTEGLFAAQVRNRGERGGEELDSVQVFVFQVSDGLIVDVRIHVDDDAAVAEFWAD